MTAPSQGLYSTAVESNPQEHISEDIYAADSPASASNSATDPLTDKLAIEQERKDLVRLGNIAMHFLKVRPWSASPDNDVAVWQHYALQPRHGEKSRGNIDCLRRTLEGMMLRHRWEDVKADVQLPPLHEKIVYLEPCLQNKMMLNTFALMMITNAVTSERKDADYFFHPKQRKHLLALVNNLRQGSFFWSGFEIEHMLKTISIGEQFLIDKAVPISVQDTTLLQQAIVYGKAIVENPMFKNITIEHEIPMYLKNKWPSLLRKVLSLDDLSGNPTLFSAPMLFDAQKYVSKTGNPTPRDMVIAAHQTCLRGEKIELPEATKIKKQTTKKSSAKKIETPRKEPDLGPKLAGAATVGQDITPKKLSRANSKNPHLSLMDQNNLKMLAQFEIDLLADDKSERISPNLSTSEKKDEDSQRLAARLRGFLDDTQMISTASSKLSYLLDQIVQYQADEKIIVFYKHSNIAYYIAQYLECLNIKHLIYASELKADFRSRYVATFNTTESFRVLLMDVSQAAFGLDISSASRVYFISPVFSPQIEAQAVKRAHRIGQTKPVYVETLVLKGSIEEVVVARRNAVSKEEHQKIKSFLDDDTLNDWIKNIQLIPMELGEVPGPEQMAPLKSPQTVFRRDWRHDHGVGGMAGIVDVQPSVSGTSTPKLALRKEKSSGRSTPVVLIPARQEPGNSSA